MRTRTAGVLLDMSKAFDQALHQKLLADLCGMGDSGNVLAWFQNYLTGSEQFVYIGVEESDRYDRSRRSSSS